MALMAFVIKCSICESDESRMLIAFERINGKPASICLSCAERIYNHLKLIFSDEMDEIAQCLRNAGSALVEDL